MPPEGHHCRRILAAFCALALLGAPLPAPASGEAPSAPEKVREPAVAGLFYPRDPAELTRTIDGFLSAAKSQPVGELKALICPHAGYPFSGPVAAYAYRLLSKRHYDTVVVMGPSHYAYLRACAVPDADLYRTPLGDVEIADATRRLAGLSPFALDPSCSVDRPAWWREASHPPSSRDTAETFEHSVEVEVPFLQRTLGSFKLVPVICGSIDPAQASKALMSILDDRTLIVASSDLSHYYPYEKARSLDRSCIDAICRLDIRAMEGEEACGRIPILVLMHVARERGWRVRLLDCRNSGDTSGDKARVVGYAAIAFYAPMGQRLGPDGRQSLLRIARESLRGIASTGRIPEPPPAGQGLAEPGACFVTLTRRGELRGCIGNLAAQGPLYRTVAENARSAALDDTRFRPVSPREVDDLRIEISVLSVAQRLWFSSPTDLLQKLEPGTDGVVLRIGDRTATYLPQVWAQLPDKEAFLDSLAEKAGCGPSDWRRAGTEVYVYEAETFGEPGA
jgi:AmmeMemoRadiSam system protein B/AmmeMemoRadiSam system protein A